MRATLLVEPWTRVAGEGDPVALIARGVLVDGREVEFERPAGSAALRWPGEGFLVLELRGLAEGERERWTDELVLEGSTDDRVLLAPTEVEVVRWDPEAGPVVLVDDPDEIPT